MPTLSMFFGIIIRMYYAPKEHNPPHIHVFYQDFNAVINISNCEVMKGELPSRQLRIVVAWIEIHREELLADWKLCQNGEKPFLIESLKKKNMYYTIKEVKPVIDYILHLKFENGEYRKFDMKPYLEIGIFQELKDVSKFNTVHISFDTVEWDNEADFDPEVLYKYSELI